MKLVFNLFLACGVVPSCFATTFPFNCKGSNGCNEAMGDTCENVLYTNGFRGSCCSLVFNETVKECFLRVSGGNCATKDRLLKCDVEEGEVTCNNGIEFDFKTESMDACPTSEFVISDVADESHYADGLVMSLHGVRVTSQELFSQWAQVTTRFILQYFRQESPLVDAFLSYVATVFFEVTTDEGEVPTTLITYYQVATWRNPQGNPDATIDYMVSQPFVDPQSKATYLAHLQETIPNVTDVSFAALETHVLNLSVDMVGISTLTMEAAEDWADAYKDHVLKYLGSEFPKIKGGKTIEVTVRGTKEIPTSAVGQRRLQPGVQIIYDQTISYRTREKNGFTPEDFYLTPFEGNLGSSFVGSLKNMTVNFTDLTTMVVRKYDEAPPVSPPVEPPVDGTPTSSEVTPPVAGDDDTPVAQNDSSGATSLAWAITGYLCTLMQALV